MWFIIEGGLFVLLGVLAAALPVFAGIAGALVFGWVLFLSGVLGLVGAFASRGQAHPVWRVVSALIALAAGILVLWAPLTGVLSLALLIAAYLVLTAISSFAMAFDHRRRSTLGWIWLIVSGVVGLVLAGLILFLHPLADAALIGFVIAINLILGGMALVGLGMANRR
jgi:uncharacterized membrane protein HdeD (DUF308 family)